MVFSSLPFLFLFFPIVFSLYFLVPSGARNLYLLASGLAFYAVGEGAYTLILVATIAFNWVFGLAIDRAGAGRVASLILAAGVTANLLVLAAFKYTNFFASSVDGLLTGPIFSVPLMHLPIGISFFTFQAISYLIDIARLEVRAERNVIDYGAYKAFFPQLIAGPIIRYRDVREEVHHRKLHVDDMVAGIGRFIIGLGKKVLIGDTLAKPVDIVMALPADELTFAAVWFGVGCFTLQIYFDFSGYSDMAIGMARMFGFHFRENFDFPYTARSVSEFWRRWHISLSTWFRDYLYIPLGGSRKGRARTVANVLIVFALCGLWHGANWTFLCWGIFHGALVAVESLGLRNRLHAFPVGGRIYTLIMLAFGWALFRSETLGQASTLWKVMMGGGNATSIAPWWQLLTNDIVCAAVIGTIGATGIVAVVSNRFVAALEGRAIPKMVLTALQVSALGGIFYASVLSLLAVGFNPFIYFRF